MFRILIFFDSEFIDQPLHPYRKLIFIGDLLEGFALLYLNPLS